MVGSLLERLFGKLKLSRKEIILFIIVAIFFILNARYVAYPDEFVNLLGGKSILHGLFPYRDFFDHHLPLAWYLSAFIMIFTGKSFVAFRFGWAILQFLAFFCLSLWVKRRNNEVYPYYLIFLFLYPLAAVYFWFHLYLGDSLAAFFFSLSFWIVFIESFEKTQSLKALIVSSILIAMVVFSSLTFAYLALALYLWNFYLLRFKINRDTFLFCVWSAAPYLLYMLFLLATGTFKDFYFANFVYNTQLYISIPNYTRGIHFNPLKFGMTLIFNFFSSYLPLLTKTKYLDLYLPINVLAGISTFILFFLLFSENWFLGMIFFFVFSFSAPRSNIQIYSETDYQSSMFLVLGLISSVLVLFLLRKLSSENNVVTDLKRVSRGLVGVFLLFTGVFLLGNFYNKQYLIYTQKMPSINNSAYSAKFVDQLINKGDYYWIGPYEPNEIFFVQKGILPGKYISLLPQFKENNYTKSTFIEQFENHRPKIIIFRQDASIFMTPALEFGDFFLDWMSDKYTVIEKIPEVQVLKSPSSFNLKTDLYLLNSDKATILSKLEEEGFIKVVKLPAKK